MQDTPSDRRGSAVRWFALTAAVLCAASLAGTQGLEWLSRSGRIAFVTDKTSAPVQNRRFAAGPGIDPMPTGSIAAPSALVIRIR
jgi:hypothetical protein